MNVKNALANKMLKLIEQKKFNYVPNFFKTNSKLSHTIK